MRAWVMVEGGGVETDEQLGRSIELAVEFVEPFPQMKTLYDTGSEDQSKLQVKT